MPRSIREPPQPERPTLPVLLVSAIAEGKVLRIPDRRPAEVRAAPVPTTLRMTTPWAHALMGPRIRRRSDFATVGGPAYQSQDRTRGLLCQKDFPGDARFGRYEPRQAIGRCHSAPEAPSAGPRGPAGEAGARRKRPSGGYLSGTDSHRRLPEGMQSSRTHAALGVLVPEPADPARQYVLRVGHGEWPAGTT